MKFKCNIKTGIEDLGKNGLITNAAILRIFERIGCYQSDEAGYGVLNIEEKGVSWILLDWKVKVIKRPKYGENLLVTTWGRNAKKSTTCRDYEIYNSNKELCVIATTKWVLIDINTRKITKITDDVMRNYIMSEKSVFDEIEIEKIQAPEKFITSTTFTPTRSNIDINGHMHNTDYLELAYETLPQEVYDNRPYNNFRINYKNEIKYGDVIIANYAYENNKHIIVFENKENGLINSIIELWN